MDLQGCIAERCIRVLDQLARIRLCHWQSQKHTEAFPWRRLFPFSNLSLVRDQGQVLHSWSKVVVVSEGLEAHAVFERDGERHQHVAEGYLGEQVFGRVIRSLFGVHPDQSRETGHDAGQLRPELAPFTVSLVCGCATERQCQTNNETEDGEEDAIDADCDTCQRVNDIGTTEMEYLLSGYKSLAIQVMHVLQRVMNERGRIIAGTTLPRTLKKMGHRE